MTDSAPAFTDRNSLATLAYANPVNLRTRVALYEHQRPRHDLDSTVVSLLRAERGPIVDVGCGYGRYVTALLADQPGRAVFAVDLSPGMLGATTAATGCAGAVADAAALPLSDDTCGAVLSMHMLYHVPEPAMALAEFARVTRPGGTVLLSTNAWADKVEMRELHAAAAASVGVRVPDFGLSMRFHLADAEAAAQRIFASVERVDFESIVEVTSPEPVVSFIESSSAWYDETDRVLDEVRRRVVAAIEATGAFRIRTHMGFLVCR